MHRRNLAKTFIAGAAATVIIPASASAADPTENVIFTEADPGHWKGVESLHIPITTVTGSTLTIKTPHPMTKPHFIVSHSVVLSDGTFLDRKTFTYEDKPISTHTLPANYAGPITITSTCNLHDFWVKTVTI